MVALGRDRQAAADNSTAARETVVARVGPVESGGARSRSTADGCAEPIPVGDVWCAVVPQKALSSAKGRIQLPPPHRRSLASAMLRDTVSALYETAGLERVYVVWDDIADARELRAFPGLGHLDAAGRDLNDALEFSARRVRQEVPEAGIVVVVSDLPALVPTQLDTFLARAHRFERAFVADAGAVGTSVLSVRGHSLLLPSFGPNSRQRHRLSGARELSSDDLPSLRHDVDDLGALQVALRLGGGVHSRDWIARNVHALRQFA